MFNMKTFESLSNDEKNVVMEMANAARKELKLSGINPLWNDSAAVFDEACAVFFKASRDYQKVKDAELASKLTRIN